MSDCARRVRLGARRRPWAAGGMPWEEVDGAELLYSALLRQVGGVGSSANRGSAVGTTCICGGWEVGRWEGKILWKRGAGWCEVGL